MTIQTRDTSWWKDDQLMKENAKKEAYLYLDYGTDESSPEWERWKSAYGYTHFRYIDLLTHEFKLVHVTEDDEFVQTKNIIHVGENLTDSEVRSILSEFDYVAFENCLSAADTVKYINENFKREEQKKLALR